MSICHSQIFPKVDTQARGKSIPRAFHDDGEASNGDRDDDVNGTDDDEVNGDAVCAVRASSASDPRNALRKSSVPPPFCRWRHRGSQRISELPKTPRK